MASSFFQQHRNAVATMMLLAALSTGCKAAQTPAQSSSSAPAGVRTIDVPNAGRIYLGAFAGQPTPADAMGKALHQVEVMCGDRPQLGKQVKNTTGEIMAAFFTVTGKNQDGKPMQGLAIVYAPKTGTAGGAVLMDYADRFPSTVNTMFTRLKQELGKAPAGVSGAQASGASGSPASGAAPASTSAPVKAGPAQSLHTVSFPDGTGVIGLPSGWQMQQAQKGDVSANGPSGEKLRFGWTIPVMGNSRGAAPGNFVAIPYGTDPAKAYTEAMTQMSQKARQTPPDVDISKVQEIPMQGGKNYMLYGNMDFHDNRGKLYLVAQMINTPPLAMDGWQMTLFVIYGPPQVMAAEGATITEIFSSYSRDNKRLNAIVNTQMQQTMAITNQYVSQVAQITDSTDRMTAGMDNILRGQTVVVDSRTGAHATTSDDLAGALINANPGRFQSVSPSGYISGIDY